MRDRIEEWEGFSDKVTIHIETTTISKYGLDSNVDLVTIFPSIWCKMNLLKYALRIFTGHQKTGDVFKIAHYACMLNAKQENGEE
jgi:hypothetical protein